METRMARHEMEQSFPHQDESPKLQNGKQSPEVLHQQANGEASWSHFKPSAGDQDSCSSPVAMQGLYETNGEMKRSLNEQCVMGLHQPKRPRMSTMNRDDDLSLRDKKETDTESRLDMITELNTAELDQRNCSDPNGNLSLSMNKQVPTPNGATVTPPLVEGPPGSLLVKTLSQYYPEQVSVAANTSSSQADKVTSRLQEQATPSPSLTSGFHLSASEPHTKALPKVASSNGYSPALSVNDYSVSFGPELQPQPYPLSDLPELETHSQTETSEGPRVATQTLMNDSLQAKNGAECFPSKSESLCMFAKSGQDFRQESYPLPLAQAGTSVLGEGSSQFGSFTSPASGNQAPATLTAQQHLQYRRQQHPSEVSCSDDGNTQGPKDPGAPPATPPPPQQLQSAEPQTGDGRPDPPTIADPHNQGGDLEQKLPLPGQAKRMQPDEGSYLNTDWIDLNATQALQHPCNQQHIWEGFPLQQSPVPQSHSSLLEPEPAHSIPTQGFSQASVPHQQNCHMQNGYKVVTQTQLNATSEWRPGPCKTPMHAQTNIDKFQHMLKQCNTSPQQMNQQFCSPMLQEKLCKNDQDLQQIRSRDFLLQGPPLTHPQQASIHQLQAAQGFKTVPQDPSQGQVNAQLQSRHKTEGYMHSEASSPTYWSSKLHGPGHPRLSPAMRSNLPDQSHPSSQPLPKDKASVFGFSDTTEMQKNQQPHYTLSPSTPKQYSQQFFNHRLPSPVHWQQPSQSQAQSQAQPQLPDGSPGPQMATQMFPKADTQEFSAQFETGSRPGPGPDLQKRTDLRMHLLQKQERPSHPQSPSRLRPDLQAIKQENGLRFDAQLYMQGPPHVKHIREPASSILASVKQERPSSACEHSQRKSILATMEQKLQQNHISPVFERNSLVSKSPGKVKVEMAGGVTVVSTNMEGTSEDRKTADFTPKKQEPGLQRFLESPWKVLDTSIKNLLDTPLKTQYDIPQCHCVGMEIILFRFEFCVLCSILSEHVV